MFRNILKATCQVLVYPQVAALAGGGVGVLRRGGAVLRLEIASPDRRVAEKWREMIAEIVDRRRAAIYCVVTNQSAEPA